MNTHGLEQVKTFEQLLRWVGDHLDWPIDKFEIDDEPFDSLTFEYDAATDLGLKKEDVAHIREIHQLRPFVTGQPWGIFFVNLEDKKIPVGVLKRILGGLTLKKRQSANKADRPGWVLHDLLFISAHGQSGERELSFLHFTEENGGKNKIVLKELGWDQSDTLLKLAYVANTLKSKLAWPEDEDDSGAWREQWAGAFTSRHGASISTAKDLTKRLANLATNIRTSANDLLAYENKNGPLTTIYENFKETIFHNLTPDDFADMYAQTISYGLLAASIMRKSGGIVADDAALIAPLTQPFLKDLMETFLAVGGRKSKIDFNELGIDEVVEALDDADMEAVLRDFGNRNPHEDPILHFYEYFLRDYDSIMREQRGVYYTPLPVVRFIVRSVDEILQKEFGLADGLADTATWRDMFRKNPEIEVPDGVSPDEPFVQILDPAAGTGTFLVEAIGLIEDRLKTKWRKEGYREDEVMKLWNKYVPEHLLPRLNGFELMMAPYAIAHIKIGMKLRETGYQPAEGKSPRLRVYLTNTLEEPTGVGPQSTMYFITESLALEAKGADEIKANTRITVVIGNPPYSPHNETRNPTVKNRKPTLIGSLIDDYYYVDGKPLKEANSKNIKADENKFIRYAEHRIERVGAGILGFISANGYLDSPTMRGMRWHLLQTFPAVNIVDLHGSVRRKETAPDGSKDENVFDIQQGVAIALMRRMPRNDRDVQHMDLWGIRRGSGPDTGKYGWLLHHTVFSPGFVPILPRPAQFLFMPRETIGADEYERNFVPINSIFRASNNGFKTHRDHFAVSFDREGIHQRISDLRDSSISLESLRTRYALNDNLDWKLEDVRNALLENDVWEEDIQNCLYRPFDVRFCYYSNLAMDRPREDILKHLLDGNNVAIVVGRQGLAIPERPWEIVFASKLILDTNLYRRGGNLVFPLYLIPTAAETETRPNLDGQFAEQLARNIGLVYESGLEIQQEDMGFPAAAPIQDNLHLPRFLKGRGDLQKSFGPRDVFDFIYAILNGPSYRIRYADFLKSDFPRIPIPASATVFRELVPLGGQLVTLHVLDVNEANILAHPETRFVGKSEPRVEQGFPKYSNGKVTINPSCWFEDVTPEVWGFHIGGYPVCQKWLKDRAAKGGRNPHPGRVLSDEDILHYRRITVALKETIRIMKEIDEVIEKHRGWPGAFATGEED